MVKLAIQFGTRTRYILLLIGCVFLGGCLSSCGITPGEGIETLIAAAPSPASTLNVPPLALGPTATREKYAINQAPTSDVPPHMQTIQAFNAQMKGTLENRPTPTDGPSAITLTGKPHMIDFNADWCAPCREMRPYMTKLANKYADKLTFWNINVDNRASDMLNLKYRVEYIPLIILLDKDGQLVARLEGYQSEQEVEAAIQKLLERS